MFTGLVQTTGTVQEVGERGSQGWLKIDSPDIGDLQHGESVAVNGVCLTVASYVDGVWVADVMRITKEVTTLGKLATGDTVNLERALRAEDRLGGHIVQGHVDGVATLRHRKNGSEWDDLTFTLPENLARYVVSKGSIAINGVSLTVASLDADSFTVSLIPITLTETNLGLLRVGDAVNIEVDILAKYVERMVQPRE